MKNERSMSLKMITDPKPSKKWTKLRDKWQVSGKAWNTWSNVLIHLISKELFANHLKLASCSLNVGTVHIKMHFINKNFI